jgi:hypothetical protein
MYGSSIASLYLNVQFSLSARLFLLTLSSLCMDMQILVLLVIEHTNNMPILFHTYMHPHYPFSSSHTVLSR